jgi:hypothetical protein
MATTMEEIRRFGPAIVLNNDSVPEFDVSVTHDCIPLTYYVLWLQVVENVVPARNSTQYHPVPEYSSEKNSTP